MSRNSPNNFQRAAEERKKALNSVLGKLVTECGCCGRPSSKARLYNIPEGLTCKYCLPKELTLPGAADKAEEDYKARLEAEKNKPKPEGYGVWE